MNSLKDRFVKIYADVEKKRNYEGDARIERVLRPVIGSPNLFVCDVCFEDSYFTAMIDVEDLLPY